MLSYLLQGSTRQRSSLSRSAPVPPAPGGGMRGPARQGPCLTRVVAHVPRRIKRVLFAARIKHAFIRLLPVMPCASDRLMKATFVHALNERWRTGRRVRGVCVCVCVCDGHRVDSHHRRPVQPNREVVTGLPSSVLHKKCPRGARGDGPRNGSLVRARANGVRNGVRGVVKPGVPLRPEA